MEPYYKWSPYFVSSVSTLHHAAYCADQYCHIASLYSPICLYVRKEDFLQTSIPMLLWNCSNVFNYTHKYYKWLLKNQFRKCQHKCYLSQKSHMQPWCEGLPSHSIWNWELSLYVMLYMKQCCSSSLCAMTSYHVAGAAWQCGWKEDPGSVTCHLVDSLLAHFEAGEYFWSRSPSCQHLLRICLHHGAVAVWMS